MPEFSVPALPYAYDALEPHIDKMTMQIHHDKHHATYVTNLNNALKGHDDLAAMPIAKLLASIKEVPESIRMAVRNNGGGHYNHTMFWETMAPGGAHMPPQNLSDAIMAAFGGLNMLMEKVNEAGTKRFGSGWAWVAVNAEGKLSVISTPNQDSPLSDGLTPILGVDVWEHAYYLKYQNKRADYLKAWWNTVNWTVIGTRFDAVKK